MFRLSVWVCTCVCLFICMAHRHSTIINFHPRKRKFSHSFVNRRDNGFHKLHVIQLRRVEERGREIKGRTSNINQINPFVLLLRKITTPSTRHHPRPNFFMCISSTADISA
uniref:Putative secreted protein n=1 Tax=Anopheles triannulatus TaxID=58253 RepID=A0A2M4B634_9DIPT